MNDPPSQQEMTLILLSIICTALGITADQVQEAVKVYKEVSGNGKVIH